MSERESLIREFLTSCEWQYRRELPQFLWAVWLVSFDDVPLDRLRRGMVQMLATSKFFPQPADVREVTDALPRSDTEIAAAVQREEQARERLLARIEWQPKPLASVLDRPQLPAAPREPLTEGGIAAMAEELLKPAVPLGVGKTAEEWAHDLHFRKQEFLMRITMPKLRLPPSGIADLNGAGGETGLLIVMDTATDVRTSRSVMEFRARLKGVGR
jgi:hypothetical protein